MGKIKIFVDTAADLREDIAKEKGIGIIRFLSVFGEETFVTGTELSNEAFYKKLIEFGDIPKTAQTPYADMLDILSDAAKEYETVIYFSISSKASGQFNTANMIVNEIKEENPNADVRIVDTQRFSAFIARGALVAADLAAEGKGADEIIEAAKAEMDSWQAYILVDSLSYLEKGGRINKASAILGTLLDIKPVLTVNNGLIEPLEKLRGKKKVFKKLVELVGENPNFDQDKKEFLVVQSNRDYADQTIEAIKDEFSVDILEEYEVGPIVGTHIGPGTLAVLFRLKK